MKNDFKLRENSLLRKLLDKSYRPSKVVHGISHFIFLVLINVYPIGQSLLYPKGLGAAEIFSRGRVEDLSLYQPFPLTYLYIKTKIH